MTKIIALAGKGGVGKTTLAALTVTALARLGRAPILAVDADPNSCLGAALGVGSVKSIGNLREEAMAAGDPVSSMGMSKRELLELRIAEGLCEGEDFDLIAMGRPEGPGCYCYANAVLKDIMGQITDNYPYVVLDNEAGLENLSRRLAPRADLLVLVADPSRQGVETVKRIFDLAGELGIVHDALAVAVNRLRPGPLPPPVAALRQSLPAYRFIGLPSDEDIAARAEAGLPLLDIAEDNPVYAGIRDLLLDLDESGKPGTNQP